MVVFSIKKQCPDPARGGGLGRPLFFSEKPPKTPMFPGTPCGPLFWVFSVFPGGGTADPCFSAKNPPKRRSSPPPEPSVRGPTEAPHKASQSAGRRGAPPVPSRAQSAFGVHISNTQIFIGSPPQGGPKKIFDPGQKTTPPLPGGCRGRPSRVRPPRTHALRAVLRAVHLRCRAPAHWGCYSPRKAKA